MVPAKPPIIAVQTGLYSAVDERELRRKLEEHDKRMAERAVRQDTNAFVQDDLRATLTFNKHGFLRFIACSDLEVSREALTQSAALLPADNINRKMAEDALKLYADPPPHCKKRPPATPGRSKLL